MTPLPRRFRRLYVSSATSNLADGIGRTVLPLLAAAYTHNPLLVAGLTSFAFLPWLLFALPSGALVDRLDRRHAMSIANGIRGLAAGTLAALVASHSAGIVVLYAVAFVLGAAETVYDSASRAILPQLVGSGQLDRANGLLTVEENLGQTFLGAPIGSALFALTLALPLGITAAGFVAAAVLAATLRGSFRPTRDTAPVSVRRDIVDGVRWLARHRFLRTFTLLSAATSFASALWSGVLVLWVLDVLRLPAGDFGYVLLAGGAGGLLGGVATPAMSSRFGRGPVLNAGAALAALATVAMGCTRNGYLGAGFLGLEAAGVMTWNVLTMSLRQALIPGELFGRVQGAYRMVVWGAIPLGSLVGGALAAAAGVTHVFLLAGIMLLVLAFGLVRLLAAHSDVLSASAAPAMQTR